MHLSFVDTTVKLVEYSDTDSEQECLTEANRDSVDMFLDVETGGKYRNSKQEKNENKSCKVEAITTFV